MSDKVWYAKDPNSLIAISAEHRSHWTPLAEKCDISKWIFYSGKFYINKKVNNRSFQPFPTCPMAHVHFLLRFIFLNKKEISLPSITLPIRKIFNLIYSFLSVYLLTVSQHNHSFHFSIYRISVIIDCEYTDPDDVLINAIITGVRHAQVLVRLLDQGSDLTLAKALSIGRQYENSQTQLKNVVTPNQSQRLSWAH